jgi:hypothetical protein
MKVNIDNIKRFKSKSSSIDEDFSQILLEGLKAYLGCKNQYSHESQLPGGINIITCTPSMLDLLRFYKILQD